MKSYLFYSLLFFLSLGFLSSCGDKASKRILVFSKTAGYRHASIPAGKTALMKLGKENGIQVDTTEDASKFTENNLKNYAAVVFLNTTGDVLNAYQEADFQRYIQAGGGFVGIHSATDTEYAWPWYNRLVGGYFKSHPKQQKAKLTIENKEHASTKMLATEWERFDEWYNFKSLNEDVNVLIKIDEGSYEGGENGAEHPMAWYHEYDGGRSFYTALGHTDESYVEPLFLQHVLGGLQYAMASKPLNYQAVVTERVPPENRFVRKILWRNLKEPMELDVFNNNEVIVVERKGRILLWNPKMQILDSVDQIPVHTEFEDGLLGVAIDPDYETNKWVYFFYSPPGDIPKQHVSRFVFENGQLDHESEKVVLEIPVQRDECCHSGGSLEFGPNKDLYITVGDDTNPFASDGFSPSDERDGRRPWDAQRSSGNTNDLRGKILRIHPETDGSYSIPEGNLFAKGMANTRPEIYVMGCRNPFRHSIDPKTGYLYWGDVGPDAGKNEENRGPKGIDEINQAKGPGNWGWPYTRGNNQQYNKYDFARKVSGSIFDPVKPVNQSPNNTGLKELPTTQASMIWYSYDESVEFPWVGVGGKNPMAGPFYYEKEYKGDNRFPEYFDGKLLIYEWMRNWIYVVSMDSTGQMTRVDPFMENEFFSRPMDMKYGPDGTLYILEYGQKWFAQNMDARLTQIEYVRGNRAPVPKIKVNHSVGASPMTVQCDASDSYDFDEDDAMTFVWSLNGKEVGRGTQTSITIEEVGIHQLELKVQDEAGRSGKAKQEIQTGNAPPEIVVKLEGANRSFYDKEQVGYSVSVIDEEDGNTQSGGISADDIIVTMDYLETGFDMTTIAQGHQANMGAGVAKGKALIDGSDCKTCHAQAIEVNGPSYVDIAKRYTMTEGLVTSLAQKIIKGGMGTWGERAMSAHPQVSQADAEEMVKYILSLNKKAEVVERLPLAGKIEVDSKKGGAGKYVLMVSYTDKGHQEIQPITSRETIRLRAPKVEAEDYLEAGYGVYRFKKDDKNAFNGVGNMRHDSYLKYSDIDLKGVKRLLVKGGIATVKEAESRIELRLDGVDGKKIGEVVFKPTSAIFEKELVIDLEATDSMHAVYLVFKSEAPANNSIMKVDWIYFDLEAVNF